MDATGSLEGEGPVTLPKPDWRLSYEQRQRDKVEHLREQRRCGGRILTDEQIDAVARREAQREVESAIRAWNEQRAEAQRHRRAGRAA